MYIEAGREYQNGHARRSVPRAKPAQPDGAPKNKVTPEWLKDNYPRLTANLDDERRAALTAQLQLPGSALEAMPIGWWPDRQWWNPESRQNEGKPGCWTFPEFDAQGRIIGLGLRWPTGKKGQLAGGRRGLNIPEGWRELSDPVLLVEGPSDVLVGRALGLNVLGRPSNSGGADILAQACRNHRVIILGENDSKPDGTWPGRVGAESLAQNLEAAWGRPVPIAFPPDDFKDLREWVSGLAPNFGTDEIGLARATILERIEPPLLLFLVEAKRRRGRPSVKAFRWSDGATAQPIHTDRVDLEDAASRRRFAKALTQIVPEADVDQIAARLMTLEVPAPITKLPRRDSSSPAPASHQVESATKSNHRPIVFLPGGPATITECATKLGALLARTEKYLLRGGTVVIIENDDDGQPILQTLKPAALASVFEGAAQLMEFGKKHGQFVEQPAICTEQQAKLILHCAEFQQALPVLRLLSRCPVLIERNGQLIQISGYDRTSGIWAAGQPAPDLPLDESVKLLNDLIVDYRFASAPDRARALAAFITPGLIMGGLLGGRAPVDLGEADDSQSGKGYRNKLTAAIFNHAVRAVTQKRGGVGSLEESFATALIKGRNFISLDNMRGTIDSPALESFLTEDSFQARVPHQAAVEIDPRRIVLQLTSNKAEITNDLANRSSCVRILKQHVGYQFREYPEGDVLDHVRANQPRYLGAVFAVIQAWHDSGKRRTDEARHDFRPWARTLDWIVQNLLGAGPLLDGHRDTQMRMSTPGLNWLRDVALAVRKAESFDQWLRAHQILDIIADTTIEVPGVAEHDDLAADNIRKKALQAIGHRLGTCFGSHNLRVIDEIEVERQKTYDPTHRRMNREYLFRAAPAPENECAYSPTPEDRLGADSYDQAHFDSESTEAEATLSTKPEICAYSPRSAPSHAPGRAPNGKAFAPNAPMGHVIPMTENHVDSVFINSGVNKCIYKEVIQPLRRIGALGAGDDGEPPADAPLISEPIYIPNTELEPVRWCTESEHSDVSPTVIELARERDGWTPSSWHNRLLQQASACAGNHPVRAAEFRQAAELMINHRGTSE
ncbi:MAG TPA: hypothetical protein PKN33_21000 [Phycisphaerae bacterium]|nr:hypothetical protein [Phycisphaerae bacterium]